MSSFSKALLLFSIGILFQSCGTERTMYIPNLQNVPQLKSKGDLKANVTITNYQFAYALTDHIGVTLNSQLPNLEFLNLEEDISGYKYLVEGGLGFFTRVKEYGSLEFYSGYGIGSVAFGNQMPSNMNKFSTRFRRYFFQPSIGWEEGFFSFSFSVRYSHLKFYSLNTSEYIFDPMEYSEDLRQIDNQTYQFLEPMFSVKAGNDFIKGLLFVQLVHQRSTPEISHRESITGFGVTVSISELIKRDGVFDDDF